MKSRASVLVLLSFALLAIILEAALAWYWQVLLEPRLRSEAESQAQVLAQAQASGIAQALSLDDPIERDLQLDEVIDGLLLLRDPRRDDPYFQSLGLTLDYEHMEAAPGSLDRRAGEEDLSGFAVQVELYHPYTSALIGVADFRVSDGFYRAFSDDVRRQLYGQGLFIAGLLALLGGTLAWLLRVLEQQHNARLAAEQALAANERKLQHLVDNLDNYFVYGRDAEGRIISVSDSVQRVIGVSRDEFVRRRGGLLTDNPINQASLQRLQQPREAVSAQFEFEVRDDEGRLHRLECTEVVVRDKQGRISAIDGIARDVTAQRRLEAELRQARDQAEAANRSKSQFLANMSHEIRTPMNAVIGMATLLSKSPMTSRQRSQLSQLEASARMLLGIIDDILDLSRIEAGRLSIVQSEFSLDELLTDLTALVGQRARDKQLDVLIDCDPAVPSHLVGDAMRLQQVLVNLVVNAIKFTERGAVVVEIGLLARDGDAVMLRFAVRDSGIGIPPEQLPRLFEHFTQMDESSTRQHGGAGLGLAISKRLVELMGGKIGAESEPGRGSTFHFSARFSAVAGDAPAQPAALRDGLRALVVDDSPVARDVFGHMLESLRFEVTLADSAERALDLVHHSHTPFDLLLIDFRLPGQNGLDAVRELRRRRRLPASLMVTAYGDESLAAEAERSGVDVFLHKPVSPSTLFDAALRALHSKGGLPGEAPTAEQHVQGGRFAPGQRVLLAEDNEINRQVAGELLSGLGLEVVMAENGRVALQRLQAGPIDLVLMDVQMPELDGIEATRLIKQDARLAKLPVVALTAHAMASDRERFLAAGMDDYLAKPIDERALVRALSRWLKREARERATETAGAANRASAGEQLPALPGIDVDAALARVNGKQALLFKLLQEFRQRHRHSAARLAELLPQDRDAALALAHTLKGAAATLGANGVADAARELEQQMRQGQSEISVQALRAALDQLQALPLDLPDRSPPQTAVSAWHDNLRALEEALEARRFDAARLADQLLSGLPEVLRGSSECAALQTAMQQLDLEQAGRHLKRLKQRLAAQESP